MAFAFETPASLAEATRILAEEAGDARVIAGGTDIVVQYRDGRIAPNLVVSLHRIGGLDAIEEDGAGGLRLGPLVTATRVARHPVVLERYPALAEGARQVGAWLIQNRATIAGNICNASPAADTLPALLAHGARVELTGPNGTREMPLAEYFTGPGRTVRTAGDILTAIVLPAAPARSASAYVKLSPRGAMDIAIVGVAVAVSLAPDGERIDEIGIGLGAVAPTPLRAADAEAVLRGQPVSADRIGEAARVARAAARPIADVRGSAEHRSEMVETLVRRVTTLAIERARGRTAA